MDKKNRYLRSGSVTGGSNAGGGVVGSIRWGRHSEFERIVIGINEFKGYEFKEPGKPSSHACKFRVEYLPDNRLQFRFYDTRAFLAGSGPESLSEKSGVLEAIRQLPIADDSCTGMELQLKPGTEWEIFELRHPGRIVVDVRKF